MFLIFFHPVVPGCFRLCRTRIPEMGDGRDGDAGRDDGVRDAGLSGHHAHANGVARTGAGATQRSADGRATRLLSDDGDDGSLHFGVQPDVSGDRGTGARARSRRSPALRLERGDAGTGVVGVLLRLHTHAPARWCAVPEVWRQAHHGARHTVHGHIHIDDAVRGAHRVQAADHPAVHGRTRRGIILLPLYNVVCIALSYYNILCCDRGWESRQFLYDCSKTYH